MSASSSSSQALSSSLVNLNEPTMSASSSSSQALSSSLVNLNEPTMSASSSSSQALETRDILDSNFDHIYLNWDLMDQKFNPSRTGEPNILNNWATSMVKEEEWSKSYRILIESLETMVPDGKILRTEYVMWYIRNNPTDYLSNFDLERMAQYMWLKVFVPHLKQTNSLTVQLLANNNKVNKNLNSYRKSRRIADTCLNAVRTYITTII
jgi:hypothetical protein